MPGGIQQAADRSRSRGDSEESRVKRDGVEIVPVPVRWSKNVRAW
jgi:hypothetical protein